MPTLINQGKIEMSVQDHVSSSMNESGTCEKIDAPLTQAGSQNVLRDLSVRRNKVGAESTEGRLISTLIQQMKNYQKESDPVARANLERFMGWTMDAIQRSA
jgi:hypothetical protein